MFVKAQGVDKIVNLNKMAIIYMTDKSDCYEISCCNNKFDITLAIYTDSKDAEKYFDWFCQAISDGDCFFFRFPDDPKLGEKNDQ